MKSCVRETFFLLSQDNKNKHLKQAELQPGEQKKEAEEADITRHSYITYQSTSQSAADGSGWACSE